MKTLTTGKRDSSLDLARILAAILVVCIHVTIIQWFTLDVYDIQWKFLNLYNTAASAAVPMFFLISGNLFLGKKEMPDLKQLFSKYILRLSLIYLLWGLFYAMDTVGVRAVLSFDIQGIWNVFLHSPKYHLWYLPTMVGIYLLLPVLWCVAHYENSKYLGYACLMFFLWRIIRTLEILSGTGQTPNFMLYLTYELSEYSGYFLLGYYLRKKPVQLPAWSLVAGYLLFTVIGGVLGNISSARDGAPNSIWLDYLGLIACVQVSFLYCAFLRCNIHLSSRAAGYISTLSKCTLFTYLFHPFVIEHLHDVYEFLAAVLTPAAAVPLMTILVQVICFAIGLILIQIPVIRKIIT